MALDPSLGAGKSGHRALGPLSVACEADLVTAFPGSQPFWWPLWGKLNLPNNRFPITIQTQGSEPGTPPWDKFFHCPFSGQWGLMLPGTKQSPIWRSGWPSSPVDPFSFLSFSFFLSCFLSFFVPFSQQNRSIFVVFKILQIFFFPISSAHCGFGYELALSWKLSQAPFALLSDLISVFSGFDIVTCLFPKLSPHPSTSCSAWACGSSCN